MAQPIPRFLPFRLAVILGLAAAALGLVSSWITGALGSWLPFSGAIPLTSLPHVLCGLTVALAALLAPLVTDKNAPRLSLTQLAFSALFQGAMFQFFLMVAARLVPLDPAGIALSALAMSLFALCCLLISEALPRAYTGLVFFWVIVLPMICYLTADIYLTGPGSSKSWQGGEQSGLIYGLTHAVLMLSPGTAIAAMLDGALPDGSYALPGIAFGSLLLLAAALVFLRLKLAARETKAPATVSFEVA